jgi:hypothetical protein
MLTTYPKSSIDDYVQKKNIFSRDTIEKHIWHVVLSSQIYAKQTWHHLLYFYRLFAHHFTALTLIGLVVVDILHSIQQKLINLEY